MGAGHRIGGWVAILGIATLAVPLSAAARQGTRVAASEPVRVTAPFAERGPDRSWPARLGAPTRKPNPAAPAVPQRAPVPKVSFSSPLNFAGPTLADSNSFPPDTQGAVGPSQFVVAINGRFRSYSKTTGLADGALNADPDAFFAPVMSPAPPGGIVFTSDPHIRYDRLSQRWFIVMIDVPLDSSDSASVANRILVAVSDGPVLTGSTVWTESFIQVSGVFADYPTLGLDANALYVGTNNFSLSGQQPFVSSDGYVIRKSSVGSGPLTVTKFSVLPTASSTGPFTPQGIDNPAPSATFGYFVGVDELAFGKLDVIRISNPGTASPTASGTLAVTVPATDFPIEVPHLGGSLDLDALDDRLFAASMRGNRIWTAHNIAVNSSGGVTGNTNRDGSRWYELDVSGTPSLVQSGTVFDTASSNPLSYWIPTVAVSGQGHMAIGGSVAGAQHHPDAWFSGRLAGDAAGTTDAPTLYTASTANYNPGNNRWGDYSAVSLDPSDDMTMWTIQEHVSSTNSWGTRIAKLRAPGPAIPASASPRALTGQASVDVTLTGTTTGGRGFFDPGPGFNRPAVSAGCGVDVTAVTVDSPSQATLTLDTTAATNAPCDVTFTNPDGQSANSAVKLLERPPAATDDSGSVVHDSVLNGSSVLANDSDPDGDSLTAAKASDPAHGTVTVNANGTYTYTPAAGYIGPDSFTYTASDGTLQDTGTVSITVTATGNHAPVAVDDAYSVAQDTVLNGSSLLANDTDADGDTLTAAKATDPSHGTVTVNSDGTFTYTPAAGYVGPDSFTYTVSDGALQDTGTASITVTHVNHAPVATDDAFSVAQDATLSGTLLANDSDPDGDTLTAAKATDPGHGSVTVNADGTFTYMPAAGYVGPDSFTYTVSDGALQDTGAASITVTHVNHAPVAVDDAYSVAQDTTLNGTSLLVNDSDPDGDGLTATQASNPAHGSVTVNPDGTFTYAPAAGYTGPDAFTYTASDGALQDASVVSITVTALPDFSNPGTTPTPITKLTLKLKQLKKRHGKRRLRASGNAPDDASVRVVLYRAKKRVAGLTVTATDRRWRVVFRFKRHGRYRVVAKTGLQRVSAKKRI